MPEVRIHLLGTMRTIAVANFFGEDGYGRRFAPNTFLTILFAYTTLNDHRHLPFCGEPLYAGSISHANYLPQGVSLTWLPPTPYTMASAWKSVDIIVPSFELAGLEDISYMRLKLPTSMVLLGMIRSRFYCTFINFIVSSHRSITMECSP